MLNLTMLSRTADSLYWMGRYLERAAYTARLLDVHMDLTLDQPQKTVAQRRHYVLTALNFDLEEQEIQNEYSLTNAIIFDLENPDSVKSCIGAARENARQIREQISTEMWNCLNQFYLYVDKVDIDTMWSAESQEFLEEIREGSYLLHGVTDMTMNHDQGWHFVNVGHYIERILTTVNNMRIHFCPEGWLPEKIWKKPLLHKDLYWMGLLGSCTGFEAYCKFYTADLKPDNILEFMLVNPVFPHSVAFSVNMLYKSLEEITHSTNKPRSERTYRLAGRLHADLEYGQIDEIVDGGLSEYFNNIVKQCNQIHEAFYESYITYDLPIEASQQ